MTQEKQARVIAQVTSGHSVLWDALVSCLLTRDAIDTQQLVAHIAIAHRNLPEHSKGAVSMRIAQDAVKSIVLSENESLEEAPEQAQKIIEELEPLARLAELPLLVEVGA